MDKFAQDYGTAIMAICTGLISLLLIIIGFMVRQFIKRVDKMEVENKASFLEMEKNNAAQFLAMGNRILAQEEKTTDIEINYKDRFRSLEVLITTKIGEVKDSFNTGIEKAVGMFADIREHFVTAPVCEALHKQTEIKMDFLTEKVEDLKSLMNKN